MREMMNDQSCIVKIIYSIGENIAPTSYPHIKYCEAKNTGKYLIGGGFYNGKRGSMLFEAKNKEEAEIIANSLLSKRYEKYKIIQCKLLSVGEDVA